MAVLATFVGRGGRVVRWVGFFLVAIVALVISAGVVLWCSISDAQLGRWTQDMLSQQFQGSFRVGRASWRLPTTVVLEDVRIDAPAPAPGPVIVAQRIEAHLGLVELLHHQVHLEPLLLQGVTLQLRQTSHDAPLNVAAAFAPLQPTSESEPAVGPTWEVALADVTIEHGRVQVDLPDIQLAAAELHMQNASLALVDGTLRLTATLSTELRLGPAQAPLLEAPVRLACRDAVYNLAAEDVDVSAAALSINIPGADVQAQGSLRGTSAHGHAAFQVTPAFLPSLPAAAQALFSGSAQAQVQVDSGKGGQTITLHVQGDGLEVARLPIQSMELHGRVHAPQVQVDTWHLQTGMGEAMLRGALRWTEAGIGAHDLQASVRGARLRQLLQGWMDTQALPEVLDAQLDARGASLWPLCSQAVVDMQARSVTSGEVPGLPADLRLLGTVTAKQNTLQSDGGLRLQGDGLDVRLRGRASLDPDGALALELSAGAGGGASRALQALGIAGSVGNMAVSARVQGSWRNPRVQGALQADDMVLQDHPLQVRVPFRLASGTLHIAEARVSAPWARVEIDGRMRLQRQGAWLADPSLEARLRMARLDLEGWAPHLRGEAHLEVSVSGSLRHPTGEARAWVERLQIGEAAFASARARLQLTPEGAAMTQLHLQPSSGGTLDGQGSVAWESRVIKGQVQLSQISLARLATVTDGVLQATAEVQGTWDAPRFSAQAEVRDAVVQGQRLDRLEASAHGDLRQMQAALHTRGEGTRLDALAELNLTEKRLRSRADGTLDLALVSALVPPNIGMLRGALSLHLQADGPLTSPQPRGEVHVSEPIVWHPRASIGDIQVHQVDVRLEPDAITLQAARGTWGTGSFTMEGRMALAALQPQGYRLRLRGDDLPVRTQDLLVEANVDVEVASQALWPSIHGHVEVTHGRYIRTFALQDFYFVATQPATDLPLAQTSPWLGDVQLDVMATTAEPLTVKVDAGAFAVQTAMSADLRVTGSALRPHVAGAVHAEGGNLHFPAADLALDNAMVSFVPDSHGVLIPTLNLHAQSEVTAAAVNTSSMPETYNVSLTLDGPLEKLGLDLQAAPGSLTRLEILCLLATGHANLSELTQGGDTRDNRMDTALAFAGAQLSEPLTRFAEKRLERLLNTRVDLAAQVTQNQLKVTASKRIGPRLRLEGGYQQAWGSDPTGTSQVLGRAQLLLTDRLMLEGGAQRGIGATDSSRGLDTPTSSLQLKWRMIGE